MIINKKGGLGDFLVTFYSYVILILVFIVFFILFSVSTKATITNLIGAYTEDVNLDTELRSALRTPVQIGNAEWTFADLVVMAANDPCAKETEVSEGTLCSQLKKTAESMFSNYRENKWALVITPESGKEFKVRTADSDWKSASMKLSSDKEDITVAFYAQSGIDKSFIPETITPKRGLGTIPAAT